MLREWNDISKKVNQNSFQEVSNNWYNDDIINHDYNSVSERFIQTV